MAQQKLVCLVTIHGIGFQQAPELGVEGYADRLHQNLLAYLPDTLGGDTDPKFGRTAQSGPIYVQSDWPPDSRKIEEGLKRLGQWLDDDPTHRLIDTTNAPLQDKNKPIAHVALIYSHLEDQHPHLGSSLETLEDVVFSSPRYTSFTSTIKMALSDLEGIMAQQNKDPGSAAAPANQPTPSLRVRSEAATINAQATQAAAQANKASENKFLQAFESIISRVKGGNSSPATSQAKNPGSLWAVVSQLEQDVSTYITRNDLRDRVRNFVHEAILRLACRDDVGAIVINAHSQGTVVAYDILRQLPPFALEKVHSLVTAGSPLRKYSRLFYWGDDAGCLYQVEWPNFWDAKDPVADPLGPGPDWKPGQTVPPSPGYSELFSSTDPVTGESLKVKITDYLVDNVAHVVGGGLVAHNYWDNKGEFVKPLAEILKKELA